MDFTGYDLGITGKVYLHKMHIDLAHKT
jgi:hypothetical protein